MSLRLVSRLALQLAAGGLLLAGPLAIDSAWAQSGAAVFEGTGLLELLPPSGLVGDGATAVDVYVLALAADGKPIAGLKGRPAPSGGTAGDLVEVGGGIYRFAYTPPKVDGKQIVTVSLKGKLPSKEAFSKTWQFAVAPARSHQLSLAANPGNLTLGQDKTASFAFNLAGGDRQALGGVDLKINSSSGTVENLTHLGGGQFTALYNTPNVNYPHVALVTVVDRRDPSHTFGAMAVPLVGKADYPVNVAPNSKVILKVGGRDFGPVAADANGRAKVPIVVPPGAQTATRVQIAPDGKITEETLDLRIPEARRVAMFPSAGAIPADGRLQVPVRAVVVTPDGRPDANAQVVFSATAGTMGAAKHEGNGVYVATYTPPYGNAATQATITVNLADKPALQVDSTSVNLVPARATKLALTSEPSSLPAGADGFKIFAKVVGPDGTGLGARDVQFAASGARLKGEIKDLRNGDYQAIFTTTGTGSVELSANVATPPTGNPLARVLLLPARERVVADGTSSAMLTVATVDEFGYPVANVPVALKLLQGDGTVPASATTNDHGIAQVYYTAGRKNGFVAIEAMAGEQAAAAALVQAPAEVALPDLPVSGAKPIAALADEWAASLAGLRIERAGATGAVAPPVALASPASTGAGAPAKASLLSEPATASAGGTVDLKINLVDANGRGVGGQTLDFLTSQGSVGAVTDLGGGAYKATFTVPPGASGEVKISVATGDGAVSSFMRLPIGGAESAWGTVAAADPFASQPKAADPFAAQPAPAAAAAQPATPAQPVAPPVTTAPAVTTVTKTPASTSDRPWLRISGGWNFASYAYDQQALKQDTVLFKNPIGVSAVAHGFGVDARAWLPTFRYVGADVSVGSVRYAIDPTQLCEALGRPCADGGEVADWITDIHVLGAGRYPFEVGANQFWVGGLAGWSNSDIQVYKVDDSAIALDPFAVNSLAVGAEIGAEIGESLFFSAGLLEHLAGGTSPYNTGVNVDAGYAVAENVFVGAAFDYSKRQTLVTNDAGSPVGDLADQRIGGKLNVGFQY